MSLCWFEFGDRFRRAVACVLLAALFLSGAGSRAAAQETGTPAAQGYRGASQSVAYQGAFSDLAVEIDAFWVATFRTEGAFYESPDIVVVEEPTPSACGLIHPEPNAFYCPFDRTIYLVPQFLTDQQQKFGDYAPITIFSHEWGHHIQALLGIQRQVSKTFELQADCLMGVFTRYADDQGLLDYGDFMEAISTSQEGGDPVVLPEDAPGSHGRSEERVKALTRGYGGGPVFGCGLSLSGDGPNGDSPVDSGEVVAALPSIPPLNHASCFRTDDNGVLSFDQLLGRFAGVPDAESRLRGWGWRASAFRVFACDGPPTGEAGWIDISIHLFANSAAAQEAADYFAAARAQGTTLISGGSAGVGDYSTTLTGPASNGQEFTVYATDGPALIRVTGVSPSGIPFGDVLTVVGAIVQAGQFGQQRAVVQSPEASGEPAASYLPDTPAVNHAECFGVLSQGTYSFSQVADALGDVGMSASDIDAAGWRDGAYVVFACDDPPFGRASQIDVVVHRFRDAAAAGQALLYVDGLYTPGEQESRSCDTAWALVICVTGRSRTGSPLSDVAFVLQDVVAAAS